jgi:hypothetical protein
MEHLAKITVPIVSAAILLWATVIYGGWNLRRVYQSEVAEGKKRTEALDPPIISEEDLAHLPKLVREYLVMVGVVGKARVYSMKVTFTAEMRSKTQDWFPLTAEQHNFYDSRERLFYLDARVKGLPTRGYHRYKDGTASMLIKLLGLIPVVDVKGDMMFKAETVTLFNDMCFLAPATLIDKQIEWEALDSTRVKATFTNRGCTISAVLHFNEKGQLINFVSDDRYDMNEKKRYRFSTPISGFDEIGGFRLPTYGEAVWHYPEGEFVYGKYRLKSIEYNVQ